MKHSVEYKIWWKLKERGYLYFGRKVTIFYSRHIFCICLLQELFYKYTILKVSESVRTNLKQPEAEVQ